MYAQSIPAIISKNVGNTLTNYNTWGGIIFNVKSYGAKGDGSTDDTAAINATIAAAVANGGGIVYFPPGTYVVSGSLSTITAGGVYFEGSGKFNTLIRHTSDTANLFSFGNEALGVGGVTRGCGISKLRVLHNSTRTAGCTVKFVNSQHLKFEELHIDNAFVMFQMGTLTNLYSNFIMVEDVTGSCIGPGVAFDVQGGVNGIYLLHVQVNSNFNGIALKFSIGSNGLDTLVIDNCLFQQFDYGFLANSTLGTLQNVFVTNTIFDGIDLYSVYINPTSTAACAHFEFDTCWFTSNQGDAVLVDSAVAGSTDGVYFSNCRWVTVQNRGFVLNSGNALNVELDNCILSNCSRAGSGSYPAVYIADNSKKFSITNCRIGAEGNTQTFQSYGIQLGLNCDLYTIANNDIIGNITGAVLDGGGTFTKKIMKDNLGFNPKGILTTPAMPASTVVQTNTFSFQVQVIITGGTVGGIAKNNSNISGMITGSLILYPGETVTITYTAAPAWTWFGL